MSKVTKETANKKLKQSLPQEIKNTPTIKDTSKTKKSKAKNTSTSRKSSTTNALNKKTNSIKDSKNTKKTSNKKTNTKVKSNSSKMSKLEENVVAEYYDLPYRYNETIVKILYQTPNILFVYWDISDDDKNNFIKNYGEHFFYNTKPILKIYNITKNYSFEIEINDFANSWYINVKDANCDYKVELARRTINYKENLNTDYIYVTSSNEIEFPNDHILLDELPSTINFKNIKTNKLYSKHLSTLRFIGINKIYNIHNFYNKFFKTELQEDSHTHKKTINTSSSSSSWN